MNSRIPSYFFFILLLVAVIAAASILLPFISPVLLAVAASVVVYPIHREIRHVLGGGKFGNNVGAFLTVVIVLFLIVVPSFFVAQTIYNEVQGLYGLLIDEGNRSEVVKDLNTAWGTLSDMALGLIPDHSFDSFNITEIFKSILEWLFANLDTIFSSLAVVGGYALVFLFALFYFLRDGESFKKLVLSWSPILADNDGYITSTFKRAIRSVFGGTLAVAILDGLSIGLSFLIFGIPAPALWGTMAAIAALVPGIGVSMIILPAAAFLIFGSNYAYAIGLVALTYTATTIVENILGPTLINKGVNIHPFLILLSALGGILMFGIIGFIMGPLILVFLFTLLEIYKNSFVKPHDTVTQEVK